MTRPLHATVDKSSNPTYSRRGKSRFLQKPKILYIGDSVAQNADIAYLERETQSRIRTKKAYVVPLMTERRGGQRKISWMLPL